MVTEASRQRLRLAKEVSLIGLIKELGYVLEDTGSYYRMTSPFRSESNPSFDIDKRRPHKFVDRGGIRGDVLDFVQELFHLNKHDAIDYLLEKNKSKDIPRFEPIEREKDSVEILHTGAIETHYLWDYIKERKISPEIASRYLVELHIRFPYGQYPDRVSKVLGFRNDSGGYEMRNKLLKIGNSPKDVTTIKGNNHKITNLYEGFFSFLSHQQTMMGNSPVYDCVILNSLSFVPQMISFWGKDKEIDGYLDNDTAGDEKTKMLESAIEGYIDQRHTYTGYNDLNDKLCGKPLKPNKSFFISDLLNK
jgi:hypothetical protein